MPISEKDAKDIIESLEFEVKIADANRVQVTGRVIMIVDSRELQVKLIKEIASVFETHIGDLENLINGWKCDLENRK